MNMTDEAIIEQVKNDKYIDRSGDLVFTLEDIKEAIRLARAFALREGQLNNQQ